MEGSICLADSWSNLGTKQSKKPKLHAKGKERVPAVRWVNKPVGISWEQRAFMPKELCVVGKHVYLVEISGQWRRKRCLSSSSAPFRWCKKLTELPWCCSHHGIEPLFSFGWIPIKVRACFSLTFVCVFLHYRFSVEMNCKKTEHRKTRPVQNNNNNNSQK